MILCDFLILLQVHLFIVMFNDYLSLDVNRYLNKPIQIVIVRIKIVK